MAVKLEVIIYTDDNGNLRVSVMGATDKKGFTDKEAEVRIMLWEAMRTMLNREFNGVDLSPVCIESQAYNIH